MGEAIGSGSLISKINEGSPTTSRRVYNVHPFQGDIGFRLTLRVILQLIRQRSDGDCTRKCNKSRKGVLTFAQTWLICLSNVKQTNIY